MKYLLKIINILFFIQLLTACQSTDTSNNLNNKKKFFRYNQSSGITSLDPAFAKDQATIWATTQLFDGLVQLDENLNVKPAIAKSWTISDDGLTYTFTLIENVQFHNHEQFKNGKGRPVTAADFVYSFSRILDDAVASPGRWIFSDRLDETEPFKAINPNTFQLKLNKAFRPILGILTMPYCYVVPKEIVEHFGKTFRTNPVGTGPFTFKIWKENEVLVLEKNNNYYESSKPYIDGVRISFFDTKKTEYLKFKDGELDFISGIDATFKDEMLTKTGELLPELKTQFNLYKAPFLNSEYVAFNVENDHPIIKNKKIRQAINYGFDREKMMQYLRNNIGRPATAGFIPPGLPSFNSEAVKGYSYNIEKAKQLLKEAGYPNGEGLPKITLATNAAYQDLGTYLTKQLAEIGLKVDMEINQSSFLRQMMVKGEVDFFRGSWIADYPDGENFLTVFYGGNPAPPNYTRFKNAQYDQLYQQALTTNNNEERFSLYHKMENILIEEAPVVPLFYDELTLFTQKRISNFKPNAQNLLMLKHLKLD